MFKKHFIAPLILATLLTQLPADEGNEAIDYSRFLITATEAAKLRNTRRVSEKRFLELSSTTDAIILDTRSKAKFDKLHVKGAVHLNFSDFTAAALQKIIPNKNTPILIYCNNNFKDEPKNFPAKSAELALNIPTFINLHGYGYTNIYELKPLLEIRTTKISFAGTSIGE